MDWKFHRPTYASPALHRPQRAQNQTSIFTRNYKRLPTTSTTNPSPFQALTRATSDLAFPQSSYDTSVPLFSRPSEPRCQRTTFWQLPSNILHQIFFSRHQHRTNTIQNTLTPWGLFTRMGMRNTDGQSTHSEQSPTIPSATRTASPELAIIRCLVHQRITRGRQRVTRDYLTEITRDPNIQPGSYFNLVARDFLTAAADVYATTIGHNAPARRNFRNMAREILTMSNDTTSPRDRVMVSHPNVVIDRNIGKLVFRDN